MRNLNLTLVFLIFLVSLFTLTFKLGLIPNGIYVDEGVSGYNAYSILKTGKDEYGKDFPIAFRFFGSYSPPLYVYLTVIPVYLTGLNEFSIRIVSAVAASLMIFVVYLFLKTGGLLKNKIIPFLLLLFIITPWNFFYGRAGYELYLGFFLFSLGVLLCWLSLRMGHLLLLGLIILSIATYASHPQIYSAPLFVLGFLTLFYKKINRRFLILGLFISLLIQIPHIIILNTKAFINKSDLFYLDEILRNTQNFPVPQILSIPVSFIYSFFSRIVTYFSPESLFFFADPDPQRSIPELSVFYNWMVVPFLTGLFIWLKNIKGNFEKLLLLIVIVSVIPPSLTRDPFSTQRALNLLLPFFILICLGLSRIYDFIKFKMFAVIYMVVFGISLILLWRSYFVLLPAERAISWGYGYKQLAEFISKNPETEFVIDQSRLKPSYIELAFFQKTDPRIIQSAVDTKIQQNYYNLNEFSPNYKFANIQTRLIDWKTDGCTNQVLVGDELILSPDQAREHILTEIHTFSDPRGYPIFKLFKTNPDKKCPTGQN